MTPDRIEIRQGVESSGTTPPILEIPRDKIGRIRWSVLKNNPEQLIAVIEHEASIFISEGNILTHQNLEDNKMSSIAHAIQKYYPGALTALSQNLGIDITRRPNRFWDQPEVAENIKNQAAEFFQQEGSFSKKLLAQRGEKGLLSATIRKYPGGFRQLRIDLDLDKIEKIKEGEVPRDSEGRIRWSTLRSNLDLIKLVIESEARNFIIDGNPLTQAALINAKLHSLVHAIQRFYPGRFNGLKTNLGLEPKRNRYWTIERIEQEALAFNQKESRLTNTLLDQKDRADLRAAIKKYPGGLIQLRKNLRIKSIQNVYPADRKPTGYWTPELIESEAAKFVEEEGTISRNLLKKRGKQVLASAINTQYPGRFRQLKFKLGIKDGLNHKQDYGSRSNPKPHGYWTQAKIIEEARLCYEKEGRLSYGSVRQYGGEAMVSAIRRKYPGGILDLNRDIGLDVRERMPINYWTSENIRNQARIFYETYGKLNARLMASHRKSGLMSAISRVYPGSWIQLRIDLGIIDSSIEIDTISPEEANEMLRRLVETSSA